MSGNVKECSVLFGDELQHTVPIIKTKNPHVVLRGKDGNGMSVAIPIDDNILSKHIMLLGGIGTGKTNAFFHIINQVEKKLSENDVMIIFDTKGDFYNEFYKKGDIVISNDLSLIHI